MKENNVSNLIQDKIYYKAFFFLFFFCLTKVRLDVSNLSKYEMKI